jgi:hypothetical protein
MMMTVSMSPGAVMMMVMIWFGGGWRDESNHCHRTQGQDRITN